jgi:hypothetical protein
VILLPDVIEEMEEDNNWGRTIAAVIIFGALARENQISHDSVVDGGKYVSSSKGVALQLGP